MKQFALILFALFSFSGHAQYQNSDTISCNGGNTVFVIHYFQETCPSACNGSYNIEILNGAGPFTYNITNFSTYNSTTPADSMLCPGGYYLTIQNQGFSACNQWFNIAPLNPTSYSLNITPVSSTNPCNGAAEIVVSGGVPPITYQWYDAAQNPLVGETSSMIDSLCAGTYYIQYWDNTPPCGIPGYGVGSVGSGGSGMIIVNINTPIIVTIINQGEPACPGDLAWVEFTISGGSGNYNYGSNPASAWVACGSVDSVAVYDDQGGVGYGVYGVNCWPPITVWADGTNESCPGSCDGNINFNDPYNWMPQYSIDGGATYQSSPSFSNLCPGTYNTWIAVYSSYGSYCYLDWGNIVIQPGMANDNDGDGWTDCAGDCDDNNPSVNPGMSEVSCDGLDNDCNPATPDDVDADGDGWTVCNGDCDDTNPAIYPGATEICDGLDNDCDGLIDGNDPGVVGQSFFYLDADADGYGDPNAFVQDCFAPPGYVADNTDCDDTNPLVNSGMMWYPDCDGDGYFSTVGIASCTMPASPCLDNQYPDGGWSNTQGDDCDDEDLLVNPAMTAATYSLNVIMPSAYGQCDGSAAIIVSGGVPPYGYQWYDSGMNPIPWETTYQLDSLCAGTYYVQYWDNTPACATGYGGPGTGGSGLIIVNIYDPVTVTVTANISAYCPLSCTGEVDYVVTGGTGNYIDPNGGVLTSVCDGDAGTITVCDDLGNCGSANYALVPWPPIGIYVSATSDETCAGACDGTITIQDDWSPFVDGYSIFFSGNQINQSSPVFTGLCPDNYIVEASIADAYGNPNVCTFNVGLVTIGSGGLADLDADGYTCDVDCDDNNAGINPGMTEILCDGIDNDCNPATPDDIDADADGWTVCNGDCDDADPMVNPGMPELLCNGIDDDCNPATLDNVDADADGFTICMGDCDDTDPMVNPGMSEIPCNGLDDDCSPFTPDGVDADADGYTVCNGDCDDADPMVNPGMAEILCDGIDNDCNPATPDDIDADADGYTVCNGDCDDADPMVNPGMTEILCNGIDDDCNPATPDGVDADADGYTVCNGDCDDADPMVNPGMTEILCDGIDNDCNPATPDDIDADADGYTACMGDCDDADPMVNPGMTEILCNGIDDDCNPATPDDVDADGDGYTVCNGDCDDADPMVNPGKAETECNGIDDDCSALTPDDGTAPEPDNANLTPLNDNCEVTPTAPTATDNCAGTITGYPDVSFPITSMGTTTITWTFDDGNGNTNTQTQDVTITGVDVTTTVEADQITITVNNANGTYQWLDCTNAYAPIVGATTQSYTATANGEYAVAVTENGCTDTSACVVIDNIGIDELNKRTIAIYPNPSTKELYIDLSNQGSIHYSIVGVDGTLIKEGSFGETAKATIALADLTPGTYFLKLNVDGYLMVKRFVKE